MFRLLEAYQPLPRSRTITEPGVGNTPTPTGRLTLIAAVVLSPVAGGVAISSMLSRVRTVRRLAGPRSVTTTAGGLVTHVELLRPLTLTGTPIMTLSEMRPTSASTITDRCDSCSTPNEVVSILTLRRIGAVTLVSSVENVWSVSI